MSYANNKGTDQPAHPRSLISAFVVRCLDSVMSLVSVTKISSLMLASVAEQASLNLTWSERLNDGPDIKLFILVGLGRSFFVRCLAYRGSTVGFLLLQCFSGVVRYPRDLQVSVATRFCRVLIFVSS